MGTNLATKEVLQKMEDILDKVLKNLESWDGSLESGTKIVEDNEVYLDEFKTFNLLLKDKSITYSENYLQMMNDILKEQKKLTMGLKIEQEQLVVLMHQLSKKDDVINSYISVKKDPIFIDKDIK